MMNSRRIQKIRATLFDEVRHLNDGAKQGEAVARVSTAAEAALAAQIAMDALDDLNTARMRDFPPDYLTHLANAAAALRATWDGAQDELREVCSQNMMDAPRIRSAYGLTP